MNKSQRKTGFYIDITCPGCGGSLELQRDFFSLECKYCGSVLRVLMPEIPPAYIIHNKQQKREVRFKIDRYLKEQNKPLSKRDFLVRNIYYPYWKIDAVRLQINEKTVKNQPEQKSNILTTQLTYGGYCYMGRALGASLTSSTSSAGEKKTKVKLAPFMTTMAAATFIEGIPQTIGMRAEYIKVKPLIGEDVSEQDEFIPVEIPWERIQENLNKSIAIRGQVYGMGKKSTSELFRPEGVVVYFPFIIAETEGIGEVFRFVIDGITGRILHVSTKEEISDPIGELPPPVLDFGRLDVMLHRCRNCGEDLPAGKSSVYICPNCHEAVSIDKDFILRNDVLIATGETARVPERKYFPFWSFKLSSDIVKRLVIPATMQNLGDRLIVPGFQMSGFETMRKLSRRITAVASSLDFEPLDQFHKDFVPVTLGLSEAETMAQIILYCSQIGKSNNLNADDFKISPEDVSLFYAPFHVEHYFYIDSIKGAVTFEKSVTP